MFNWFAGCSTIEEVKKRYRQLAQKHHPDHGGTNEDMTAINLEYEKVFAWAKSRMDSEKAEGYNVNDGYREMIDKLLGLDGIEIELCGSWLWIGGDTKKNKDQLKAFGCSWAGKKKLWYWKPAEYVRKNRKTMSMEWIRDTYGSENMGTGTGRTAIA